MAEYQVLYWRHIPSMVVVRGAGPEVQGRLPQRYQEAIDESAMLQGAAEGEAYLEGWAWGPIERRAGSPEQVLAEVLAELEQVHPVASAGEAFSEG